MTGQDRAYDDCDEPLYSTGNNTGYMTKGQAQDRHQQYVPAGHSLEASTVLYGTCQYGAIGPEVRCWP